MKWQQSVQKEFLKIMRQPTSGTKVVLVQRILNCIPIEEAIKVVQEYKVWKNTKEHKELSKPMEIKKPLMEEEERKAKMLSDKRIERRKYFFRKKEQKLRAMTITHQHNSSPPRKILHGGTANKDCSVTVCALGEGAMIYRIC